MDYWKMFFERWHSYDFEENDNAIAGWLLTIFLATVLLALLGYINAVIMSIFLAAFLVFSIGVPLIIRFQPHGRLYWDWYWGTVWARSSDPVLFGLDASWTLLFSPGIIIVVIFNLFYDTATDWDWRSACDELDAEKNQKISKS